MLDVKMEEKILKTRMRDNVRHCGNLFRDYQNAWIFLNSKHSNVTNNRCHSCLKK